MRACAATRLSQRIVDLWFAYQVELHGQYSSARLRDLQTYLHTTSLFRVTAICFSTPLLCLALIISVDCIPLAPPEAGASANYVFWCRNLLTVAFMTLGPIKQFQQVARIAAFSTQQIAVVTVVASVTGVGFQFLASLAVGFPLPFSLAWGLPVWSLALFVFMSAFYMCRATVVPESEGTSSSSSSTTAAAATTAAAVSRAAARTDLPAAHSRHQRTREVVKYARVFLCQASLVFVYPAYIHVFQSLGSLAQTLFVLALPLIKIVVKNCMCHLLGDLDDIKPEFVILNIEVFNAFYVSCCMQSSLSVATTLGLTLVDWGHSLLSIRDVHEMVAAEIDPLMRRIPHDSALHGESCVAIAVLILDSDPLVRSHACFAQLTARGSSLIARRSRRRTTSHPSIAASDSTVVSTTVLVASPPLPRVPEQLIGTTASTASPFSPHTVGCAKSAGGRRDAFAVFALQPPDAAPQPATVASLHALFSHAERLAFAERTAQLLYTTEFLILIEFTEVIVPVMYGIYIVAVFSLPNRAYYPQLAQLDAQQLTVTIGNMALYAGLELFSLLSLGRVLQRKVGVSPLRQLAFVLDSQWAVVQAKLLLWIFYAIQNSLVHFGADFSLRFEWLRHRRLSAT